MSRKHARVVCVGYVRPRGRHVRVYLEVCECMKIHMRHVQVCVVVGRGRVEGEGS